MRLPFKVVLALLSLAAGAGGQPLAVRWSGVDGGGGTSTGGAFQVTGTIGQSDAGSLRGGSFRLTGGFWGVLGAVQAAGAPALTITRTATNTVVVAWPLPDSGWRLQATKSLRDSGTIWTEIAPPYHGDGTSLYFVEPVPIGDKFYRLHKP